MGNLPILQPPNSPPAQATANTNPNPNTEPSGDNSSGSNTNTGGDTSGSSSGNTGSGSGSGTDTSTGSSNGNLQTFGGALGGISAPAVTKTSDGKFQTDNNTFESLGAALDRSCSVQHNQCADQANKTGNKGDLTVGNCDKQSNDCQAAG
ncbi:hypothetical protein DL96DRAFT_1465799 [Flagelloscypha sp. PMI_526]|nr:hypothetical protein DL96DRAFT_1465799 [Flagelloscypha sp. PMI_526]